MPVCSIRGLSNEDKAKQRECSMEGSYEEWNLEYPVTNRLETDEKAGFPVFPPSMHTWKNFKSRMKKDTLISPHTSTLPPRQAQSDCPGPSICTPGVGVVCQSGEFDSDPASGNSVFYGVSIKGEKAKERGMLENPRARNAMS